MQDTIILFVPDYYFYYHIMTSLNTGSHVHTKPLAYLVTILKKNGYHYRKVHSILSIYHMKDWYIKNGHEEKVLVHPVITRF